MTIKQLISDYVLVEPVLTLTSGGGIVLPESLHDSLNVGGPKLWRVAACGPGRLNRKGIRIEPELRPGYLALAHSYTSNPIDVGGGWQCIRAAEILAVFPDGLPK